MPSRKSADGEYRDIAHPINSETRQTIQELIMQAYENAAESGEEEMAE
jgi:stage V sporulation protein G